MVIDEDSPDATLVANLDSPDWATVLDAVSRVHTRLGELALGDRRIDHLVAKLATLASHAKWEVRRAVANTAAYAPHPAFEPILAKLAVDDNGRVRQAAEHAALRRRDSRHASALGRQHEERLSATLDGIEVRFGPSGRNAVRRAAEQIADTFARELYHEVIKLLSPLAVSAERLRALLVDDKVDTGALLQEADRIGRRVGQLRAVLDAMRSYTEQPTLVFEPALLRSVVEDAASLALEAHRTGPSHPRIEIDVDKGMVVEMARARLVQALTNVFANAIEACDASATSRPVQARSVVQDGIVTIAIQDFGCGMSPEAQRDAVTLFATSKPNGTGFGLPLAIKIVEAEHRGRLELESVEGRGTTVRITMRAVQERGIP